jgi:hypothetical protein
LIIPIEPKAKWRIIATAILLSYMLQKCHNKSTMFFSGASVAITSSKIGLLFGGKIVSDIVNR